MAIEGDSSLTMITGKYHVPSSNQTWRAGKFTIYDGRFSQLEAYIYMGFPSLPCLMKPKGIQICTVFDLNAGVKIPWKHGEFGVGYPMT